MKKILRFFASVAIIVMTASCAREMESDSVSAFFRKYSLSIEEQNKTELYGSGSTRQVNWREGDEIKYYTSSGQMIAGEASVKLNGSNASVEIPHTQSDEFINAVYGASILDSEHSTESVMYVSSPVKDIQSYTSFSQAHLCAAFSEDLENQELSFHNAATIVTFKSLPSVHRVVFKGNKGETITAGGDGLLKISYAAGLVTTEAASASGTSVTVWTAGWTAGAKSDFYIAILPVIFNEGITVDCYDENDGLIVSRKTDNTVKAITENGAPRIINLGSVQEWLPSTPFVPEAVDLGLSVKWATCNVGATKPEEYGEYFAWGETEPKENYNWTTYKWCNGAHNKLTRYCPSNWKGYWSGSGYPDDKARLDLDDDAAHVNWGGSWRMPTKSEFDELIKNCTWTWTGNYNETGVAGRIATSKKTGYTDKSIFLPAAGYRYNTNHGLISSYGRYWSSSLLTGDPGDAWYFYYCTSIIPTTMSAISATAVT